MLIKNILLKNALLHTIPSEKALLNNIQKLVLTVMNGRTLRGTLGKLTKEGPVKHRILPKSNQVSNFVFILQVIKHYYPGGYFGVDKLGCPIFIDPVGTIDFKGIFAMQFIATVVIRLTARCAYQIFPVFRGALIKNFTDKIRHLNCVETDTRSFLCKNSTFLL